MNEKLCHVLHYLIYLAQTRNWPVRTKIRLAKSVIFAEIATLHYLQRPLTSIQVVKTADGALPFKFEENLQWLLKTKRIGAPITVTNPTANKYESLISPDISSFIAEEVEIIAAMGSICCQKYTDPVLINFNNTRNWEMVKVGEVVPVSTYVALDDEPSESTGLSQEELDDIDRLLKNPL